MKPELDPTDLPGRSTSGCPEPFRSRVLLRDKRARKTADGRPRFSHKDGTAY